VDEALSKFTFPETLAEESLDPEEKYKAPPASLEDPADKMIGAPISEPAFPETTRTFPAS